MNTPLQKAAQAMIDRWDSTDWKDTPHTAHYIAELRKTLDAELAQSVEPVAWAMRRADGLVLDVICPDEHESHEGEYTMPLYLHPPQPQATTPVVPEGYVLVPVEPTPAMCAEGLEDEGLTIKDGFKYAYALYTCMIKTAQGEKPQATTPAVSNDWLIRKEPNTKDKYYVAEGKPPANVLEIYEITGEKP